MSDEKISCESVNIKISNECGNKNLTQSNGKDDLSRLRRLEIEVYHRGGKLSKQSIESLKKTIYQETQKLLLKDQFLTANHPGIKAKEWVQFHKQEEMERRRTTLIKNNEFSIRESRAEEILEEIEDMENEILENEVDGDEIEYETNDNFKE